MLDFLGLKDHRKSSQVLWILLVATAISIAAGAAATVVQYPFYKFTVVLSAMFVCALMSQHELRLPRTQIEISVGDIIAIWGVFWLGVSGGVLLGAAASASRLFRVRPVGVSGVLNVSINVISVAAAAGIFSLIFLGEHDPTRWSEPQDQSLILVGAAVISGITFTSSNILEMIFRLADGANVRRSGQKLWRRAIQVPLVAIGGFTLCTLFAQFGLSFGLVVVPMAVFAMFAYSIHLNGLQLKTSQVLEASRIHLATVEALATAIDARDRVGHGHARRTQIYAVGLGEAIGLGDADINALRAGALLHDIGKLAVPDHILSKAGPLTPAELEKTKIHATVGAAILERVGFDYPVVPTVKYHHERWDGKGYPDGLAGEDIPMTARILAIADTFDTLRSERSFRPAMSRSSARDLMLERVGTHFDPSLVGVFLKKLKTFEAEVELKGLSYEEMESADKTLDDSPHNFVDQIKLANKEVFTLFELAREFGSSENLDEMLSLYTTKISELVPFDTGIVYLLDTTRRYADASHVHGKNKDILLTRRIKVGEGATGVVLKKRDLIKNVNPDLDFSLSHLELTQQYSTMLSLPLLLEDDIIGAISLYSHELDEYGDEHIRLLETVSRIAAEAISKTQQHAVTKAHALTDPMTGLPNARSLQIHFEKEVGRAARAGNNIQVLVMDLDGFKAVNDTFGHKAGDQMLREVGRVISEQLRDYDFLSRYGGDEFVAIIPEADERVVSELCTRIERAVSELKLEIDPVGLFASVGVSLGAASYPFEGETFDQIIVAADKAMYQRKSSRKNRNIPVSGSDLTSDPTGQQTRSNNGPELPAGDSFIVELDETHVIMTASVN